ncbi:hypothetical protein NS355_05045 [Sphingomonas yabuuchiae]|uniref:Ribbon-helix-helix protein CopG domain-containing protein n=1 Tax=Sphingomonas yabuuchiae TaxID=172044 RepID=A0A147IWK4_9SPHN|nr:hypothetical protein NS355_05045 [Sphingomonas yabuuchiae]
MDGSIGDIPKKRGRKPQGGRQEGVLVRMPAEELAGVDEWRADQGDQPTRPEAIRRLVRKGLETR